MREGLCVTLCVDALEPELSGIGRYAWELAVRLPHQEDINSVRYLARGRLVSDPVGLLTGAPIYRGRGLVRLKRALAARRAVRSTLVHSPNYFLPDGARAGVITVHDLSVFRYPEMHPAERVEDFRRRFTDALDRAAHIITDTETVRAELIEEYAVASEKVSAVWLGVSEAFRPRDDNEIQHRIAKWGLTAGAYGLCVSTLEPRKKVLELVTAWRRLPIALRNAFPLILTGGKGWRNDEIHDAIKGAAAEGWLRHLGFVDEPDLPYLYAGAALFIYPSIYEGFGLPPLEAMASGVPVIVANRSCMPEVCGSAARYTDPDDADDLLTAISHSLDDAEWRAKAARDGVERAAGLSWDRCMDGTIAAYRQAASR